MSSRLLEHKHEISYLKSRVELAQASSITSLGQRTVFVFAPNATGTQPSNVFTSWTSLLSAVSLTRGPITIQIDNRPDGGAAVIPGGDLSGHEDIWLVGQPGGAATAFAQTTITGPFTNGWFSRITNVSIGYTNALAPMITFPQTTAGNGVPTVVLDEYTLVSSSGDVVFHTDGANGLAFILMKDDASTALLGNAVIGASTASNIQVEMYDHSAMNINKLQTAGGATIDAKIYSPAVTFNTTQVGTTAGVVYPTYTNLSAADALRSWSTDQFVTNLKPAAQTNPVNPTDIVVAQVTPRTSGTFLVTANLQFQGTVGDTIAVSVHGRLFAPGVVLGNATASGVNCFFATADGPITYSLGASSLTALGAASYDFVAGGPAFVNFSWSNIVDFGTSQLNNPSQFFTITVQRTAGAGGISGQAGPAFPMVAQMSAFELSSLT